MSRRFVMTIMAAMVALLLTALLAKAGSVLPPTIDIKAPPPSTTLSSPDIYAGVNLTTLSAGSFSENVTARAGIVHLGPRCIPIHQETNTSPFVYLSIIGTNDTVTLVSGDVCTLAIDLGPFYWDFANATLGPQPLTGGTSDGLALAFQQHMGQLRFWSHSVPTAAQRNYTLPDANLADLTLSPVYSPSQVHTSYADALTTVPTYHPIYGISYIYSMPTGSFDTNTNYIPIPYSANATVSGDTWSLGIMPSYCDVSNTATSCSYWFGDSQMLFYVLPSNGSTSTTGSGLLLSCDTTATLPLILSGIAIVAVVYLVEFLGRP